MYRIRTWESVLAEKRYLEALRRQELQRAIEQAEKPVRAPHRKGQKLKTRKRR